jgi:N-acetylmuramoyl-L-alanine amidase
MVAGACPSRRVLTIAQTGEVAHAVRGISRRQTVRALGTRFSVVAAVAALAVGAAAASSGGPPRPTIVWKPIPFTGERKAETAAYARRHYGLGTWRLVRPRVIVEHYTASDSLASTLATFSADVPDAELHELPGTCAHFVIDRDGTIYQLVPLTVMCRHTVGLNYTAIGIEHVATSDRQVLSNSRQLASSLALTLWLMASERIELRDVIGHAESLTSRYHHELVAAWRCQTHGDWTQADMQVYRAKLAVLARRAGVPLGPRVRPRASGC